MGEPDARPGQGKPSLPPYYTFLCSPRGSQFLTPSCPSSSLLPSLVSMVLETALPGSWAGPSSKLHALTLRKLLRLSLNLLYRTSRSYTHHPPASVSWVAVIAGAWPCAAVVSLSCVWVSVSVKRPHHYCPLPVIERNPGNNSWQAK